MRTTIIPSGLASCLAVVLLISLPQHATADVGTASIDDLLQSGQGSQEYISIEDYQHRLKKHKPWTHPPNCTRSTSLKTPGKKYCVHTHDHAFKTGVSIIATPKRAATMTKHLNEDLASYFFTSDETLDAWHKKPKPYEVTAIEGKGKALVAKRKIKKYETFVVDSANIVMDLDLETSFTKEDIQRLLSLSINQLRDPSLIRTLSTTTEANLEYTSKEIDEDIMHNNALQTQIGNTEYRVLFPLIARINHACDPNAFVMFSQSGLAVAAKAYRVIEPGEEITLSYLPLGMTSAKRQESLSRWGFTCTCSLCSQSSAERNASDARRQTIADAEPQLATLWREEKYQAAIRLAEQVLHLMVEENLTSSMPDWYVILARLYLLGGAREEAQEFADAALEILEDLGFLGGESRDEWGLERLLKVYRDQGFAQV